MRIKICGITSGKDALDACEAGADALGFIFWEGSKRYIAPREVRAIVADLPPFVTVVGVFVDESREGVAERVESARLDVVQLHGSESPEFCAALDTTVIKAFRVRGEEVIEEFARYPVSAYLLDTYQKGVPGGTGLVGNWEVAKRAAARGRVILSGGLTPENVAEGIKKVMPYGVDVSGGVEESDRKKSREKMRLFVERARGA